jgi:tRNA pseudouridine synthase 10
MDQVIITKVKELLKITDNHICNYCLGRKFSDVVEGNGNLERGIAIRKELTAKNMENLKDNEKNSCVICGNTLKIIDSNKQLIIDKIEEKIQYLGLEFDSFLIGSKIPKNVLEMDISINETMNFDVENIKKEINRTVGKELESCLDKVVDFNKPDIVIMLDLRGLFEKIGKNSDYLIENNENSYLTNLLEANDIKVRIQINPIFIEGKYLKLIRGIPQTKWPCRKCKGKGCEACKFTGKMYDESVEELISNIILKHAKTYKCSFHGAGREDIDVKMLGSGRPFVLEIKEPRIRKLDLNKLSKEINEFSKGKTKYLDLKYVEKSRKAEIKTSSSDTYKIYSALVECDDFINEETLIKLQALKTIKQQTPNRVNHRRADKVRIKEVKELKTKLINHNSFEVIVKTQGGLYIKELISGDDGRTNPNISDLLNVKSKCKRLDVIEVGNDE